MANFKDTVDKAVNKKIAKELLDDQKALNIVNEQRKVSAITEQFSDTLLVEKVVHKIKEQMADEFRQELEDGLAIQISESVRAEVTESVTKQLTLELDQRVIKSNMLMIECITKLAKKLDHLNASLNIQVPTPIVHVNVPNVTRNINRDKNGLVESITEVTEPTKE